MSRFESAVHNIGHHAVSGMSDFLQEAYSACEAENIWNFKVDLPAGECMQSDLNSQESFHNAVKILKKKYESILINTSGIRLDDVTQATVEVDFPVNDSRYEVRKKVLEDTGVWYGHDPIYRLTVSVQLGNGHICKETFTDEQI